MRVERPSDASPSTAPGRGPPDVSVKLQADKTLSILNAVAAVLHTIIMVAVIAVFYRDEETRNKGELRVTRLGLDDSFVGDGPDNRLQLRGAGTIDLKPWLVAFELITVVAHVAYFLGRRTWYAQAIAKGTNQWRYVEYGLSATVMLLIVMGLTGSRNVDTLVVALTASVGMFFAGAASELATADGHAWSDPRVLLPNLSAWFAFVGTWVVIGFNFFEQLKDGRNSDNPDQEDPPGWLWAIYLAELVFFLTFGINSVYYAFRRDFRSAERNYIVLSFAAKATLAGLMMGGLGST